MKISLLPQRRRERKGNTRILFNRKDAEEKNGFNRRDAENAEKILLVLEKGKINGNRNKSLAN